MTEDDPSPSKDGHDAAPTRNPQDDAAEIARLMALSPLDYDREREAAAKRLGARVSILDRLVQSERTSHALGPEPDRTLHLPAPEPWPVPIEGAELLEQISFAVRKYVVTEAGAPEAIALWVLHAHALDAFAISPRLAITSAEKRCGKTTLLDVLGCLVTRPLPTANATAPAIFRSIESLAPTLLIDEADTFLRRNDELRGVLNSGHRKATARVLRVDGEDHTPRQFGTWAPTAIAMIGRLPDTLADRSIEIRLRRRLPGETVARFRADRASDLIELARKVARWAADHIDALRRADPGIPSGLHDRAADNWSPLFAIAEEAGGEWPERARRLALAMQDTDETEGASIREQLLSDIRAIFEQLEKGPAVPTIPMNPEYLDRDRIRSSDLARALANLEGHPWAEWGSDRRAISLHVLARLLKPFGISPATHRFNAKDKDGKIINPTCKGYLRSQFDDAFARYLGPIAPRIDP